MVKTEFKSNHYTATIEYHKVSDLHYLIDELIEYVGSYQYKNQVIKEPVVVIEDEDTDEEIPEIPDIDYEEEPNEPNNLRNVMDEAKEQSVQQTTEPNETSEANVKVDLVKIPKQNLTKEEYKNLLEQTDITPNSYKNYIFYKDPIWSMSNAKDILEYLKKRINEATTPSNIQGLYRLFTLFFKLNKLYPIICTEEDLKTLREIFEPVKAQKNNASKKKIPSNVPV